MQEPQEITLYCNAQFIGEMNCPHGDVSHSILS